MSTEDLKPEDEGVVENDIMKDEPMGEEIRPETEDAAEATFVEETSEPVETADDKEAETSESDDSDGEESSEPTALKKSSFSAKKLIIILVAVLVVAGLVVGGVFVAKRASKGKVITEQTTQIVSGEKATEKAEVKQVDAIDMIQALSDEELGLKKDDYSFMVAQQAYAIGKDSYVQVIAAEKIENEDGSFQIIPHGKYYISFDGKTILRENMEKAGEYTKIK